MPTAGAVVAASVALTAGVTTSFVLQDLKREHIHAVAILPKEDKVIRMNAQTARIEAGSVHLPRSAPWLDDFFREVLAFPVCPYNDQIDAFSQALNYAFNRPSFEWTDVALGPKVFVGGNEILVFRTDRAVGLLKLHPDRSREAEHR